MSLTFDQLSHENAKRCEAVFHSIERWSPLEWAGAMCGEAGEAANVAKKIVRGDPDWQDLAARRACVRELADVVIYADLLATRLGVSLEDCVIEKFNEVSERRDYDGHL